MVQASFQQTVKIHFSTVKAAIAKSVDGSCTRGMTYRSGRVKTWIAHVAKEYPNESRESVLARL